MDGCEPPQIMWVQSLDFGLAELDAWHKKLCEGCNELMGLLGSEANWVSVISKTETLVESFIQHFRFEENIMRQVAFPRVDAHVEEHHRLEQELRLLVERVQSADGSRPEHREQPTALRSLLIDTMVRHDLDFKSHLNHWLERPRLVGHFR